MSAESLQENLRKLKPGAGRHKSHHEKSLQSLMPTKPFKSRQSIQYMNLKKAPNEPEKLIFTPLSRKCKKKSVINKVNQSNVVPEPVGPLLLEMKSPPLSILAPPVKGELLLENTLFRLLSPLPETC